jgi:hypothetical protein
VTPFRPDDHVARTRNVAMLAERHELGLVSSDWGSS